MQDIMLSTAMNRINSGLCSTNLTQARSATLAAQKAAELPSIVSSPICAKASSMGASRPVSG